jgi:hypothetical protein
MSQIDPTWVPAGEARYASLATAIQLSVTAPTSGVKSNALTDPTTGISPVCARHAIISIEVQPVRETSSGTTPTSTLGLLCPVGTPRVYKDATDVINALKFIETTASAALSVEYFV